MNDQARPTKELEHFKSAKPLKKGALQAYFSGTQEVVCVRDTFNNGLVIFDVAEARALREWLDKVIP